MDALLAETYRRIAEIEKSYNQRKTVVEQKPPPSLEASLKYMAWDMKRQANACEGILQELKDWKSSAARYTDQAIKAIQNGEDGVPF